MLFLSLLFPSTLSDGLIKLTLLLLALLFKTSSQQQDLATLDVTKLTPLSPEVISRQATINIGEGKLALELCAEGRQEIDGDSPPATALALSLPRPLSPSFSLTLSTPHPPRSTGTIGHVAHGKSTVVKAISGVQTVRFKNELERNITIKLGYANAKIYKAADPSCPRPRCYRAYGSSKEDSPACDAPGFEGTRMELLRHVSFVDCPGASLASSCFFSSFLFFLGGGWRQRSLVERAREKSTEHFLPPTPSNPHGSSPRPSPALPPPFPPPHPQRNLSGHDILMATMLNGAAVMDGALLLIAANETCPQPQTSEHLAAVEIMRLKHIIILQNKIDLIPESTAANQHEAIAAFVQGTIAEGAPVVPISAQLKYNVDAVCEYIVKKIPVPVRDFTSPPQMIVIRSFDVNKPGSEVEELRGGVAGGSILQGVLRMGQEVEVRPGIVTKDSDGRAAAVPIHSRVVSLFAESNELQFAVPGGLIGVGTTVDPTLTRADRLVGQVLGQPGGSLPDVFVELEVNFFLLRRLLGVRTAEGEKKGKVSKLAKAEVLMLNIGSCCTGARVVAVKGDLAKLQLTSPVCTKEGEKVALSRRVEKHWRLIGWGSICAGTKLELPSKR